MDVSHQEALVAGFVGLLGFLLRSFFSRPAEDAKALKSQIDKLDGRIAVLAEALHRETVEQASLKESVRAVWRVIDNAHTRASDVRK